MIDSIFFDQMDLRGKGFVDYEEFKKGFNITHPEIVDVSFELLKEYLYHNNPTQFSPQILCHWILIKTWFLSLIYCLNVLKVFVFYINSFCIWIIYLVYLFFAWNWVELDVYYSHMRKHFYALLITYTNKNCSLILKYLLEMPFDSYQGRIA